MKNILTFLALSLQVATADPPKAPIKGELCRLSGDTNQYVVVWVPDSRYPVNCLTNGTNIVIWKADGPTFIGIAPTNDLSKLAILLWPTERQTITAIKSIKEMQEEGTLTNVINEIAVNGQFCAVRGHSWGDHMHVTLEYVPSRTGCRECKVCKKHQERYQSDWK